MRNQGSGDDDDARGYEEVLGDSSSSSDYDNDKIQKRPYRWWRLLLKLEWILIKEDDSYLDILSRWWWWWWTTYGMFSSMYWTVTVLSEIIFSGFI